APAIPVLCVFDSEEVGSRSVQGADSTILEAVLTRICGSLGLELHQLVSQSFMVSADNAHALHPNHPEFADANNAPVVNGGIVLKFNANQRYTTDGVTAALLRKICGKVNVPVQTYCNRADLAGGSTLGNISLNHVSVLSADIGLPQLAMHSCFETAGVKDAIYLEEAMAAFYSTTLEVENSNYNLK
ncbi:MAG: M18 family aminopeptidase, partial [Clostridia bacterium]|nr:M18 family aminopeptidase [Clostridia bacterium]